MPYGAPGQVGGAGARVTHDGGQAVPHDGRAAAYGAGGVVDRGQEGGGGGGRGRGGGAASDGQRWVYPSFGDDGVRRVGVIFVTLPHLVVFAFFLFVAISMSEWETRGFTQVGW